MRLRKIAMETTPADRATFADSDLFTLLMGIRLSYMVRECKNERHESMQSHPYLTT